jgi:hypothetical protein
MGKPMTSSQSVVVPIQPDKLNGLARKIGWAKARLTELIPSLLFGYTETPSGPQGWFIILVPYTVKP